jgi:hypothetical protein
MLREEFFVSRVFAFQHHSLPKNDVPTGEGHGDEQKKNRR